MRPFAAALFTSAMLAFPALAEDVTIATAQGDVTLPAPPANVVAFDVAAIDSLNALGVTPAAVPDQLYVPALVENEALKLDTVGTLFEPDLEKLAGLAPDLIIVGGRSAAQKDAVAQVAPAINMTIGPDLIGDAKARIDAYGSLFAKSEDAAKLNDSIDTRLAELKAAGEGKGTALVLMTNGPKIAAYGTGSRFGWLHDATGMAPAIADLSNEDRHGNALTPEAIADANPDWLLVLDRGAAVGEEGQSAEATLKTPLIEGTTAWQKGQVVYLPAAEMYIGGGGYGSLMSVTDALLAALTK
ncbi:siderophore ABC transporter substrate-binding protein [Paracoccus aurantiacus]|uniref:Siderophore ABC transporter substrate-binding protein n=1 Tax=Paracoccus aurantiacus TaxID=2599412 RepID=A0A5C6S1S4_9RHOB|nr:siderophore ABC transporter substrate-binding protein [Paracoccus aurantiacus]TXB68185.1 siderophore ABC transporter substrate-binding protein [Paracoccus aurantiacus]